MKNDICAVCQFCTYEVLGDGECYCHNEQSRNYGRMLSTKDTNKLGCDDFSPHLYYEDLSLRDALKIFASSTCGATPVSRLPGKSKSFEPFLVISFKTNKLMEDFRDAMFRLFEEYMDIARKDGDFIDESD